MGIRTIKKMYFRLFLLVTFSVLLILDNQYHPNLLKTVINFKLLKLISIIHIIWLFLFIELLMVLIPKLNKFSYSGKHLLKFYKPASNFDTNKLNTFTKQNGFNALKGAIFWILFNTPFAVLFLMDYIEPIFFYWLFFLYYFFDTVCINIFCIFHLFIVRNKCCNECRIYNWGHIMYTTPLLFIPNFWNYSLVFLSIIILIHWEISAYFHPERFSSISNLNLQCQHCVHECRYNTTKKSLIQNLNKLGQSLYQKLTKEYEK